MNRKIDYIVAVEWDERTRSWSQVHLFMPAWDRLAGKYRGDNADFRAARCGFQTQGNARRLRLFGLRSTVPESGVLGEGRSPNTPEGNGGKERVALRICQECEALRINEPEPRLWCVQYERRGLIDGKESWVPADPEYFDAMTEEDARETMLAFDPGVGPIRIIGVAPTVGMHAEEKQGQIILSA